MHLKLEKNDNIYNSYNGDITDNNKNNYNNNFYKYNIYEKDQQNYNKNKTQIMESNHYISFKKKINDNKNKLNDKGNDISSPMILSRTEIDENNEFLYPQNSNWLPYKKKSFINSENNYYPKNKKNNFNQYRQKFKKGKNKKNINYNNMNYLNMTDIMAQLPNNISYDDSKADIPIMNNNNIDSNDLNKNSNNNNQINNNIYQNNNNIIFAQNNYYRIPQRNKGFFNNQILRDQNGINDYKNNYNYNYNKNLRQNYNLNKTNMNINLNKNYINNFISPKANNYDLENIGIKKANTQGNYTDQNYSKKLSNKFNTNNSLDNIVYFYNNPNFNPNNNFILNNNKDFFKNNNNFINNSLNNNMNYNNIINNNNVNNKVISEQKEGSLKQLNIRIKLGENSSEKNIIIDINNDNRTNIVNNIIKDNNLDQSYFEPLLNIIENTINLLNNFDKLKVKKYKIKKENESKELFKGNNLNDSFILYLIENNIYKKFADEIKPDKYNLEMKQIRNFSFNFKRNKFKNKFFFD